MSIGNIRTDRIMEPLLSRLPSRIYNRLHEVADSSSEETAEKLVMAIEMLLNLNTSDSGA